MKNKVAIVSSNYYENITEGLVNGAKDKLDPSFDVYDYVVDGAWELIYKINQLSSNDSIDKFIAIGVIVKGDTDHYEYISKSVSDGLINLTINKNIYIANCVLNVLNLEQANERISANKNKGSEAASALNNLFL
jgi:6,7-dimethyl-8-ribityllumazine synthase